MSRGFASNYRIILVATGLFLCFGGLGARLVWLHVIDRDELLKQIVKTRHQVIVETARRGDIVDRHGALLATSRPLVIVAIDPQMVEDSDEAKWPELAKLLGLPLEDVRRICTTKYRTVAPSGLKVAGTTISATGPAAAAGKSMLTLNLSTPAPAATSSTEPVAVATTETEAETPATKVDDATDTVATADDPKTATDAKPAADDDVDAEADAQGRRAIRWAKLSDHVTESTFNDIAKLGLHGLCPPERRYARVYPHNELASHIVGFANNEGRGAAGIEAYADFYLRGQNGWREGERDGRNHELAQFQTRNIPKADGYSVTLSLDATIQDIVEQELETIGKKYQPLKATIIVSDPRTGFILAMANYPTFDPNQYNLVPKDQMVRMKNVAVADEYEPGSVFKIVAASAALQERLVTPQTSFNCGIDHVEYRGKDRKLPGEDHHFGQLSVAEIIAHSSNRGAAQLAMLVGEEKFYDYARGFGFGAKLGFPVGGEVTGTVHKPGTPSWDGLTITRMPMGQSVTATALQMHMAMSTIASGGVLMKPQVIKEIRDASNNVVYAYGPTEINRVVSEATAKTMARLLQGVASPEGTAPGAAIKINGVDYEVGGKTGTAQKYEPIILANGTKKLVPSKKHHVASFIGFFPASRPQVAISVIVDDADAHAPNGVAYGATVAAPVFKSIGEKLITILSITAPNQPAHIDFVAATEAAGGHR